MVKENAITSIDSITFTIVDVIQQRTTSQRHKDYVIKGYPLFGNFLYKPAQSPVLA